MIAAVFPGQGSQFPGMGKELFDASSAAREVFQTVSDATKVDVANLCFETDEDTLRQTQNAQLALYTCGLAAYRALGIDCFTTMAGHSVGEYAALAAAEIVKAGEGAKLVQRRGDLMARSGSLRPGTMSAILGLEREALEEVCRMASDSKAAVVVANDNCPGQLVISGDTAAVERAEELAKEAGAKRAMRLNVSGAFHSPLMLEPARSMALALKGDLFQPGKGARVYANVLATPPGNLGEWPELLETQLSSTVRWTETIQNFIKDGVDTVIEFGAGEVLCGLIRRISKDVTTMAVKDVATIQAAKEALGVQVTT
jgi:[acyl-carrier-protein] S-malonyltransferase